MPEFRFLLVGESVVVRYAIISFDCRKIGLPELDQELTFAFQPFRSHRVFPEHKELHLEVAKPTQRTSVRPIKH